MNIHIIHLPETFPYLADLSLTFNKYGFETVTLVANGFNQEQINALSDYADKYDFLKILDIPTRRILSHGQALNYAFNHSDDELFCFADHDIFPIRQISNKICANIKQFDVVCFGDRPENISIEYKGLSASAIATKSNIPIATSFFSVYKRAVVELANSSFNVGFEQYFRHNQVPKKLANHPDIKVLREPFLIDTSKALSIALFELGKTVIHFPNEDICHLGGLTGAISRFKNNGMKIKKEFIIEDMPSSEFLKSHYLKKQRRHPKILQVKRCISDFALQLLIALKNGNELPKFICEDEDLCNKVSHISKEISRLYIKE